MKITGCEQLKSLNTARCECGFLSGLPAVCSRIFHFINLSLKVSTPNGDLRLLSSSNATEIRSGIKKSKELSQCRSAAVFWEIWLSSTGKDKAFSLESLAEWLPALSLSGDRGDSGAENK